MAIGYFIAFGFDACLAVRDTVTRASPIVGIGAAVGVVLALSAWSVSGPIATSGAVTTEHGMLLLADRPEDAPSITRMLVARSGGVASVDPQLRH